MKTANDLDSMDETLYLLSNAKNTARLFKSIQQFIDGDVEEHELIDE